MGKEKETAINKLTEEQYKAIASAVKSLLQEDHIQEMKQQRDDRIGNAKMLLQNYRRFKAYAKNAIGDIGKAKGILSEMMYEVSALDEELKVESIIRTKERTLIMVAHIEKMISVYKSWCYSCGEENAERRYNIIYDKFISNCTVKPTAESLAEKYFIDRKTVFNDISKACDEISPLFFGSLQ